MSKYTLKLNKHDNEITVLKDGIDMGGWYMYLSYERYYHGGTDIDISYEEYIEAHEL